MLTHSPLWPVAPRPFEDELTTCISRTRQLEGLMERKPLQCRSRLLGQHLGQPLFYGEISNELNDFATALRKPRPMLGEAAPLERLTVIPSRPLQERRIGSAEALDFARSKTLHSHRRAWQRQGSMCRNRMHP